MHAGQPIKHHHLDPVPGWNHATYRSPEDSHFLQQAAGTLLLAVSKDDTTKCTAADRRGGSGVTNKMPPTAQKLRGTICFLGGITLVMIGWPIVGMMIEAFGILNLFGYCNNTLCIRAYFSISLPGPSSHSQRQNVK